eukprot:1211421-Rhodomonas_salina.3
MSGTELAYGTTGLRNVWHNASVWCYAGCGTELEYGAMQCASIWCYAVCGTELAYGATSAEKERLEHVTYLEHALGT